MTPIDSATGMNSSGEMKPRCGCGQRSSASTPSMRPVRVSTIGW
jgi:hypothetical protein